MISKNEHEMTSLCYKGREVGLITANQLETMFFLYVPDGKDYKKIGKGENPIELEKKFKIYERASNV